MKTFYLYTLLLLSLGCKAQEFDLRDMKRFDEKVFKDWEKDPKYTSTKEMKFYKKGDKRVKILFFKNLIQKDWIQVEESSMVTPYTYIALYDSKTKNLLSFTKQFYMTKIGIGKEYDAVGKLTKEEDYDEGYTFTIKDLAQKILKEYKVDLEDKKEDASVRRKEYNGNLFYEVELKIKEISVDKYRYLLIDGKTGALLFETFFYSKEHPQVFPFDEYLNSLEGKAQKKNRDFSILDTAFETFDYSEFERQNKKYKGVDKNGFEEEFTFDDGTKVLADTEEVFVLPKKDFYVGYKAFYKNGYIKEKGRYFGIFELNVKSIKIGKWYYFDEKGDLINTVDEDLKFGNFSSQDVLNFLEKKKYIRLKNGKNRENVEVDFLHSPDFKKRLWSIIVYKGKPFFVGEEETKREGKGFYIDANTREQIELNELKRYKDIIPNFEISYPFLIDKN